MFIKCVSCLEHVNPELEKIILHKFVLSSYQAHGQYVEKMYLRQKVNL